MLRGYELFARVSRGKACKSFGVYQLTVTGKILRVAKEPQFVVPEAGATLTCSGGYCFLGVSRGELAPFAGPAVGFGREFAPLLADAQV